MRIKPELQSQYDAYKANNSKDGYSKATLDYTEAWAELMERKIQAGEQLSNIAKESSHEADTDGITGFMYGCAVKALAYFWEHGEDLRRWHNKDCQIGTEGDKANETGGVLNPAVINIVTKS